MRYLVWDDDGRASEEKGGFCYYGRTVGSVVCGWIGGLAAVGKTGGGLDEVTVKG